MLKSHGLPLPLLVWLVSLHTLKHQKHRIDVSREAASEPDVAADNDVARGAKVWALVRVSEIRIYHAMLKIPGEAKRQLKFWQQVTDKSLHGEAFLFDIEDVLPLPEPVDVQQFGESRFRSFVAQLEMEQGPRLWTALGEAISENVWAGSEPPKLVLRAAEPYIRKVLNKTWGTILLPHLPSKKGEGTSGLTMGWDLLGVCPGDVPTIPDYVHSFPDHKDCLDLSTSVLDSAIDMLQSYGSSVLQEANIFDNVEYDAVQRCVAAFQALLEGLDPSAFARSAREMTGKGNAFWKSSRRPYQAAFLVKAVTMASLLQNSSSMHEVLRQAAAMILPQVLHNPFKNMLDTCKLCVPHASTISRWKLLLDGGFMLLQRRLNESLHSGIASSGKGGVCRFLMADASTQHGREFEHIMLANIRKADLARLYRSVRSLLDQWNAVDDDDSAALQAEESIMADLSDSISEHHLPLMALGSGRTSLQDKFMSVMYAMMLESGYSAEGLRAFAQEVCCGTFDLGVEFSLNTIMPAPFLKLFPWYVSDEPEQERFCGGHALGEDGFDVLPEAEEAPDVEISLQGMLSIPGPLHILHNASRLLLTQLPYLGQALPKLVALSRFLASKTYKQRLLETCFATPVSRTFAPDFNRFHAKVNEGRWGSVAFAIPEILHLQVPLRRYWNLRAFNHFSDDAQQREIGEQGPTAVKLESVNETIESAEFWAQLQTLERLFSVVRELFEWLEACPCHYKRKPPPDRPDVKKRWMSCPLRGRRLAEISCGGFFEVVNRLCLANAAQLYVDLPESLPEECRAACLLDYEHGRGHLTFQLTLKLSCFLQPPLLLLGLGHHDSENPDSPREVMQRCLGSECQHPQVLQLSEGSLREEADLFIQGEDLSLLENLELFVASFRFAWGTERKVEGGHAQVHMYAAGRRNRTEATDSLALRLGEIKRVLTSEDTTSFIECIQVARNPQKLIARLGLSRHPACALAKHGWDRIYRKVVYHADPYSLYNRQQPVLYISKEPVRAHDRHVPLMDRRESEADLAPELLEIQRVLALRHLKKQLETLCKDAEQRVMCSCQIPAVALKLLLEWLAPAKYAQRQPPETPVDAAAPRLEQTLVSAAARDSVEDVVFFRIVSCGLSRAHLAAPGDFQSNDVGILLLRNDGPGEAAESFKIETSGMKLQSDVVRACDLQAFPMVLSLSSLTLPQLRSFKIWKESTADVQVNKDEGTSHVLAVAPAPLMTVREQLELADCSMFELVEKLCNDGWECMVARTPALQTEASNMPYRVGEQKRWWLSLADVSDPHNTRLRAYVRALLTADNHHCDVAHFQTLADYLRIVDPHELAVLEDKQRKARKRKSAHMQVLMDMDDWDILETQPKPKAKRSRKKGPAPKRARRKQPLAAIESQTNPALALDDAALAAGDGDDVVDGALRASEVVEAAALEDDGSQASEISSDELLQELRAVMVEGDGDGEPVRAEGAAVDVDAAAGDSDDKGPSDSSSSSSSSSSDSDSGSTGSDSGGSGSGGERPAAKSKAGRKGPKPKAKAKGKAKPSARSIVVAAGSRDKSNRVEYGLHHLVPRFKDSVLVGYQMTCCVSGHNTSAKCTREMSVSVAGSAEDCRRILKAWVLLGHSLSTREEHMDRSSRDSLQEALKQGTLLSEKELDSILAMSEDSEIVAPFCEPDKKSKKKKNLLGGAGSVPRHIHEDMESLASSGGVPITTLAQRQRNKLTSSTSYGVPSSLQTALTHGYIGPNLPPPRGYYWAYHGGSWMLKIRGG
ncbi:unnamed protein product [Symbiodinium sp. CCMP2456]|nr:unnamed protein product [Symbiodinium sp. CCMP2456]